jgi:hypothetical protein
MRPEQNPKRSEKKTQKTFRWIDTHRWCGPRNVLRLFILR